MGSALVVAAIDVGGTTIKCAIVTERGQLVGRRTLPTPAGGDIVAAIAATIGDLTMATSTALAAAGVAVPGLADPVRGVVEYAANLGWRDLPLRAQLEALLGVPVAFDHDARVGGAAELRAAGRGEGLVFIPIATGVSAAFAVGGAFVRGARSAAGEFGHMIARPGGEPCNCGGFGCVEVYASGRGIASRYRQRTGVSRTSREIAARIDADPDAGAVWADAISALTVGIVALSALLDPDVIVVGGGVSLAGSALLVPLRHELDRALPWRVPPPIAAAHFGAESVLAGATLCAWARIGHEPPTDFFRSGAMTDGVVATQDAGGSGTGVGKLGD
jgi:glucokinase